MPPPLETHQVTCTRIIGAETSAVRETSIAFDAATLNLVFGPKGCGKNLLLRMLGLIEQPDSGEISVLGKSACQWSDAERAEVRSRHFGFVFESPFLLPSFNVVENVAMPYFKLTGASPEEAREETDRVLKFVGLADQAGAGIETLSLPVQLRVALARALVNKPMAVFVENIDQVIRDDDLIDFLELLAVTRRVFGCCVIVTSTERDLTPFANRAVEMAEGRIVRDWLPGGLLS